MSLIVAGACAAATGGIYAASCLAEVRGIHDWCVKGAVWRTTKPHIVLTFDDGPHPERTPKLLDVLAEAGVKAVFFMVGSQAKKHPNLVRQVAQQGHQIGNHSWSHPWMIVHSTQAMVTETKRCQDILADLTGQLPRLARPPYGQKDYRYYSVLKQFNLVPVLWSRNIRDYWGSSAHTIQRRLQLCKNGDILLMHDGDDKARHTISAVESWLKSKPRTGLI